jgi:uncharacterized protein (DUF736 family)
LFNRKENIMANIGTFTAEKDGFTGTLRTLTLNVKAKLVPNDKGDNEKAPDFRLQAASHDIGAAWKKTSEAGRDYLSVTVDDQNEPTALSRDAPWSGFSGLLRDPAHLARCTDAISPYAHRVNWRSPPAARNSSALAQSFPGTTLPNRTAPRRLGLSPRGAPGPT